MAWSKSSQIWWAHFVGKQQASSITAELSLCGISAAGAAERSYFRAQDGPGARPSLAAAAYCSPAHTSFLQTRQKIMIEVILNDRLGKKVRVKCK
jgi:hypothetical protein